MTVKEKIIQFVEEDGAYDLAFIDSEGMVHAHKVGTPLTYNEETNRGGTVGLGWDHAFVEDMVMIGRLSAKEANAYLDA